MSAAENITQEEINDLAELLQMELYHGLEPKADAALKWTAVAEAANRWHEQHGYQRIPGHGALLDADDVAEIARAAHAFLKSGYGILALLAKRQVK